MKELLLLWQKTGNPAADIEVGTLPLPAGGDGLFVNFLPTRESENDIERIKNMIRNLVLFAISTGLSRGYNGLQSAVSIHAPGSDPKRLAVRWKFWLDGARLRGLERQSKHDLETMPVESLISGTLELPLQVASGRPAKESSSLPLPC